MHAVLFPDDHQFEYEALRALGHSAYNGAELGEVLAICSGVQSGDYDSWYTSWRATADRLVAEAAKELAADHRMSARDGFLRASNYYRTAEFFLHGDPTDPRMRATYDLSVQAFRDAAALCHWPLQPVEIPYEGVTLSGYHYRGAGSGPRPLVLMHTGFDGTAEEMHFFGAAAAAERGYDVLVFDGPGQPSARHRHGLPFRTDWEHVVAPVLDWALTLPDVDADRVALVGLSLGGVLAPRAAAFEPRLAACIAVDGVYDVGTLVTAQFPFSREQAEAMLRAEVAPDVDTILEEAARQDSTVRWALAHGCWVMGKDTPRQFLAAYLGFSLAGGVAERIACPTLVCEAESDMFFPGQPGQLMEHLTCPKTLLRFTAEEGAGLHCHVGAQRLAFARIYDWLDEVLQVRSPGA